MMFRLPTWGKRADETATMKHQTTQRSQEEGNGIASPVNASGFWISSNKFKIIKNVFLKSRPVYSDLGSNGEQRTAHTRARQKHSR
jgi:hypothetical protein